MTGIEPVLSWRQRQILEAIREFVRRKGYSPSLDDIGQAVGLASSDGVAYQLAILERKGYLRRAAGQHRSISLEESAWTLHDVYGYDHEALASKTTYVPSLGQDTVLPLPKQVVGDGPVFVVEIGDNSMHGASILQGDLVVARWQPDAWSGLLVVEVDGQIGVRDLRGGWLLSRHPDYAPQRLRAGVNVQGPVVAVMRRT